MSGRWLDWFTLLPTKTSTIDGTEQITIADAGLTKKATLLDIVRYVLANGFGSTDLNIGNRMYTKAATKTLTESSATGVIDIALTAGIVAGGLFGFVTSFGNLEMTLFLIAPGMTTLPIAILQYLEWRLDPAIAAASVMQISFIAVAMLVTDRFVKLARVV